MRKTRFDWRHQYDEERDIIEGQYAAIAIFEETLTIQDPDSDLNVLVERFGIKDGSIIPASLGVTDPRYYGDFTDMPDLKEALDRVRLAEELFMTLPAKLRTRFDNSPWKLNDFITNTDNIEEGIKLGLLKKVVDTEKPPVIVPPTPTPEA